MRLSSCSTVGLIFLAGTLSAGTLHAQATVRTPTRVRGTMIAVSAANACAL